MLPQSGSAVNFSVCPASGLSEEGGENAVKFFGGSGLENFQGELVSERGTREGYRGIGRGELKIDVDLVEPVLGVGEVENFGGEVFVDNVVAYVKIAESSLIEGVFLHTPPGGQLLTGEGRQLLKCFYIWGITLICHVSDNSGLFG